MKVRIIDPIKTGKNIQAMCKEKGLSISNIVLALQLNSPQSVYKWFSEKSSSIPSIDHLVILAGLLDCYIDDLLIIDEILI